MALFSVRRGLSHCSLEGIADIRGEIDSKRTFIETGGSTAHRMWSYGSAQVIGTVLYMLETIIGH